MLSDFGTSQDMIAPPRPRTGNTGTMEYAAPESLMHDQRTGSLVQLDTKADMWSLGMILHKILFFRLPYINSDNSKYDELEREILAYRG